jgi:hypothetical protein
MLGVVMLSVVAPLNLGPYFIVVIFSCAPLWEAPSHVPTHLTRLKRFSKNCSSVTPVSDHPGQDGLPRERGRRLAQEAGPGPQERRHLRQ